jgi:agmatinase
MMRIAEIIGKKKSVTVIDVSELCPVFDGSGTAARLAVCVVTRIMAARAKARGEEIEASIRRSDLMAG